MEGQTGGDHILYESNIENHWWHDLQALQEMGKAFRMQTHIQTVAPNQLSLACVYQ